ncbi:MGMT family protein [Desulfopila sp. IMCC35008]|uniref:MGMT family protein n=1 Tax=Desulfopila sp. IMCC35008 TaxID=2653858 RepID=UPI0013D65E99|nr:MGMT family protein [Desulfopila sp. IMCC35008]
MTEIFTTRVRDIISSIPPGRVMTYGLVASRAGNRSGARQVARILHSSSEKYDLPWHRVMNRDGKISLPRGGGYEQQKELLEQEGIVFGGNGCIDLEEYLWPANNCF